MQLTQSDKKIVEALAERGEMTGYQFHQAGKKVRYVHDPETNEKIQREYVVSSATWHNFLKKYSEGSIKLIQKVQKESREDRGRKQDFYWLTANGVIVTLQFHQTDAFLDRILNNSPVKWSDATRVALEFACLAILETQREFVPNVLNLLEKDPTGEGLPFVYYNQFKMFRESSFNLILAWEGTGSMHKQELLDKAYSNRLEQSLSPQQFQELKAKHKFHPLITKYFPEFIEISEDLSRHLNQNPSRPSVKIGLIQP